MLFGEFLARIRDLEIKFGYVPDNYLMALRGKVIHSSDYSLYLSGDAILDSMCWFRLRLSDPVSPVPGSSRDSDSVILFLCSLMGMANPYPPTAAGKSGARTPWGSGFSVSATTGVASGWSSGVHSSVPLYSSGVVSGVSFAASGLVASSVASGVAFSVASLVSSSAGVGLFGSSGVSVPSVGVPPLGSQSLPSSFAPWVASSVASASSWSFRLRWSPLSLRCSLLFHLRVMWVFLVLFRWLWAAVRRRLVRLLVRLLRCPLFWLQFQRLSPL